MAKCVFCGNKASIGKSINRASFDFKDCAECYERLKDASDELVESEAYKAGIYPDRDALAEKLIERKDKYLADLEAYHNWVKENACGTCPRCGGTMVRHSGLKILTDTGDFLLPTIDVNKWNTGDISVEPHICEDCGYMDFYSLDVIERKTRWAQREEDLAWMLRDEEDEE